MCDPNISKVKRINTYERLRCVLENDEILIGVFNNRWRARDPADGELLVEAYNFKDFVRKLSELTVEREE